MNISLLNYRENTGIWRNIRMLFSLYWPILKPSFIIFAIYPFVAYFLAAALKPGAEIDMIYSVITLVITLNLCLSPILLTQRDFRDICIQLPVNTFEKLAFLVLTFCFLVPAIIFVSMFMGQFFGKAFFGTSIPIDIFGVYNGEDIFGAVNYYIWFWTVIASIVSVVLYCVVQFKTNRVRSSIIVFIILYLLFTIADYFCYLTIKKNDRFCEVINPSLMSYYIAGFILVLIGLAFLIILYKKLRHSGF